MVFWGTELFQALDDNGRVRLGTTLRWPILNGIISQEEAKVIKTHKTWLRWVLIILLFVMVPFFSFSTSILPTWLFLNTLQLVAHLPLLYAKMPPIINYFLLELLSFVKMDWLANMTGQDLGDSRTLG